MDTTCQCCGRKLTDGTDWCTGEHLPPTRTAAQQLADERAAFAAQFGADALAQADRRIALLG